MATDPVCGMEVEPNEAAATSTHEGQTIYFCSEQCKEEFDTHPADYSE